MKKVFVVITIAVMVVSSVFAEQVSFSHNDFSGYGTKVITATTNEGTPISVQLENQEDTWINCDKYLSVNGNGGKFTLTATADSDITITGITVFFANDAKYSHAGADPIVGYAFNSYVQMGEDFNMYGMIVSVQIDYSSTTALSDVEVNKENAVSKIMENGQIVILKDGVHYNTVGQEISHQK